MSTTKAPKTRIHWSELNASTSDGRRQRSDRSRRKIIEALFDLLQDGEMWPTAASVADRAGVGLRTVFRHFEDMDSIFEEMTEGLSDFVMPMVEAPFESVDWQDQLVELVERNARLYELIFPMQVALVVRRFQSEFLQQQYNREVKLLRSVVQSVLPKSVRADTSFVSAVEVSLTFATWRRLREDQNLSAKKAEQTLKRIILALIASHHER